MTKVTLINPWSKAVVWKDTTELVKLFDAYVALIDDETIEAVNDKVTSDDKAEWLAAWAEHVGPEAAGRIVLGS